MWRHLVGRNGNIKMKDVFAVATVCHVMCHSVGSVPCLNLVVRCEGGHNAGGEC